MYGDYNERNAKGSSKGCSAKGNSSYESSRSMEKTLEDERAAAKEEMQRQVELVKEQTRKDIKAFQVGGEKELSNKLEELEKRLQEEHDNALKNLSLEHAAQLEEQEKELTIRLTEEFKLLQASNQDQHKQMLFKLGHSDTAKRLAMEKARPEKRKTSWFPFIRRKDENANESGRPSVGRTMHSDSVTAAQDVVVGGY